MPLQKRERHPPRRLGVLLAVAAFVYIADVVSKVIVVATLSDRPPIRLLGGFLTLRVLRNSGAAFSIGTSMTVVFTLIAVAVIVVILRTSWRLRSLPWAIALGLLLGGATGNLTDRLLRSPGVFRGDVVDWIQLPHWPVFNLADSAIVCGVVLWALLLARGVPLNGGRREHDAGKAQGETGDEAVPRDHPPGREAPGDQPPGREDGDRIPRRGTDAASGRAADAASGRAADPAFGRGADGGTGDNRV